MKSSPIVVTRTSLQQILPLRTLFLRESNFQVRYNAVHERGWSDSYLVTVDSVVVGYGSVKGAEHINDRDTVFEFFLLPSLRDLGPEIFRQVLSVSSASFIECQTNDVFLTSLLYEFAGDIHADVILFKDRLITTLPGESVLFRRRSEKDTPFEHTSEPVGDFVLERDGEVVATGGFLLHYNFPFADLYMEVRHDARRLGLGSYLIQEIKKQCYQAGRVPAARCHVDNMASRKTLLKAGMEIAGFLAQGRVRSALR